MAVKKYIDIEKILKEKSPSVYKSLPRFVINWLKKKIHEDQTNEAMARHEHEFGLDYNNAACVEFKIKVEAVNSENVPETGGIIVAANHPLAGLDGIALIKAVGDIRADVKFFVNDILRNLKNYGDVFIGVNKVGTTSREALQIIEEVYSTDSAILIFPAGLVSRKQGKEIMDLDWNKSFVAKAIKYKKTIVPAFIEGRNSSFFYNLAHWRKKLGIKGNIEMLFLPDEMWKLAGKTIKVHFGKPFSYELLDSAKSHSEWAATIKKYVYSEAFRKNVPFEEFIK
jgi:putative hemolysin